MWLSLKLEPETRDAILDGLARTDSLHDLAEAIRGIAKEVSAPSIYRGSAASEMIDSHTSGRANRTLEIHKLLSSALLNQSVRAPSCRN